MLNYETVCALVGEGMLGQSALNAENELPSILSQLGHFPDDSICLELGTLRGISTAVLASCFKRVITIDTQYHSHRLSNWLKLNVEKKIEPYIVVDYAEEEILIGRLDFDIAFIDTIHDEENTRKAFEMVKKCGLVLFHDAHFEGVKKFVESIGASISDSGIYAVWREERNGDT